MAKLKSIGQINTKSLRERVLDSLRTAIITGELKPGETLVETDLASQFGVSRAPLREAINILNAEGLVETLPYHGTTVKKLARKDIEELYSVRSMMEGFAIQRIIDNGRASTVAEALRAICQKMLAAAEKDRLIEVNRIDRVFHDTIIANAQNQLLTSLWNNVTIRVQQVMSLRNQSKGDLQQITLNHLTIVAAIEAENVVEAVQLINDHIGSAGDLIVEGWEEPEP
ncbi:MAG: GntR family transcriptional regulator [Anaerolineaceae bacterium]|nr:MAG: GntR family transcriptional regulator [Anaerolineaceae bacterium]